MEEARDRARTVEDLVPLAVERVLNAARLCGAAEGRRHGRRVAEAFPDLARAEYLSAYMDLELARGLLQMRVAGDALLEARRLAPDCVDVAAALGNVFRASRMLADAEAEFRRAQSVPGPADPAENNVAYNMYGEEGETGTTAAEGEEEARDRARRSYARMAVEDLVPPALERVLDAARLCGAAEGRRQGRRVAKAFPDLARAQYLSAYMDLQFERGLDASIDRILILAERA